METLFNCSSDVEVKIIRQGNAKSRSYWENFMFAIAVECSPLNTFRVTAPVELDLSSVMSNYQLSS